MIFYKDERPIHYIYYNYCPVICIGTVSTRYVVERSSSDQLEHTLSVRIWTSSTVLIKILTIGSIRQQPKRQCRADNAHYWFRQRKTRTGNSALRDTTFLYIYINFVRQVPQSMVAVNVINLGISITKTWFCLLWLYMTI